MQHDVGMQGLKSLNKTARDLLLNLQKIDGSYYPEVSSLFSLNTFG